MEKNCDEAKDFAFTILGTCRKAFCTLFILNCVTNVLKAFPFIL